MPLKFASLHPWCHFSSTTLHNTYTYSYLRVFLYTLEGHNIAIAPKDIFCQKCVPISIMFQVAGCLSCTLWWSEHRVSHILIPTHYTLCAAPADGFLSLQWTLDIRTCPLVMAWGGGWGGWLPVYAVCSSGKRQKVRYVSVVHIYLFISDLTTQLCKE